jgi:DNA invertase Pin-like site-specific DNA recombinase
MTKRAAIWARVSTSDQASLPDQVGRAREKLEKAGFFIPPEYVFMADWTSLDLFGCPQFQNLIGCIRRKEVQALGILDRDRLQAEGIQRLTFLAECKDAGVELVLCQGPAMIEGDEGQLIEMVLAMGKKRSVLRARQGARDGLHDKVKRSRKPTSKHKIYGYCWDGDLRLVPDNNWAIVKLIFDLALDGKTYNAIKAELGKRGIPSPSGSPNWNRSTVRFIIDHPIYAGRYYALKTSAIEPKKRQGNTYGNSSSVDIPIEHAVYLPEVEVLSPTITWEQYQQIHERRLKNQELAKRNAKHDFLLRGMIFCESHRGKNGKPRLYTGWMNGNSWTYACQVGDCVHPYLKGPEIEEWAKLSTWCLMNLQPEEFYEKIANNICNRYTQESISTELKDLKSKYDRNINADTELENRNLMGREHPEVYRRLKVQFQTQRDWIDERKEALNKELAQLEYHAPAIAMLGEIREKFRDRLQNDLSKEEWREIFVTLNLEIHIRDRNHPETFTEAERQDVSKWPEMDIRWGITPKPEALSDIVFREAASIYP